MTAADYSRVLTAMERDPSLSSFEKRLLRRVLFLARNEQGACWARNETLAGDLGVTERHVTRGVSRLRAAGLLDWEFRGRRGAKGNADRLLRPRIERLRVDERVYPERPTSLPCEAHRVDSIGNPHALKREEKKREAEADPRARTRTRETAPAPEPSAAAAASPLSLEGRLERLIASEAGRKGGEAASVAPVPCPATASLPAETALPPVNAPVDTLPGVDSRFTASEEPPEVREAVAALRARGLDGTSPEAWVRRKGAARALEVCRWADRQPWRGDPDRPPAPRVAREIICALKGGYGTAPLPGSEAEAGIARDQPRRALHPCTGPSSLDPDYVRKMRGQLTEEERAREARERDELAALMADLRAKGWRGVS